MSRNILFTSESVSEGHPDKVCDQVSDAVLDALLTEDPKSRVACECFAATGMIVVGGEITTNTYIDIQSLVRQVIEDIGYTKGEYRFDAYSCAVLNVINQQSADIAMGVDTGGAGDQGMMFGYAVNEKIKGKEADPSMEYMPYPIMYSHRILQEMANIRKNSTQMPYLRPDSKAQVTLEYDPEDWSVVRAHTVVVSTQHDPNVSQETIKSDVINHIIKKVIPAELLDDNTIYYVNPTGNFVIGGPHGDTGLTGRKIIVDTYGGRAPHGGGAFSGKDSTKVDRSAAYASRHIAKNIVAAGLANECTIQLSYAIGVASPVSINVQIDSKAKVNAQLLEDWVIENSKEGGVIDCTPKGIINRFGLQRPIFRQTAAYGHFGRPEFPWEELNVVDELKKAFN